MKKIYCENCKWKYKKWVCEDYATQRICSLKPYCRIKAENVFKVNADNNCVHYKYKPKWWKWWVK